MSTAKSGLLTTAWNSSAIGTTCRPSWPRTSGSSTHSLEKPRISGMPTLAVLVGILVNNVRLSDMRGYIDNRFDALQPILDARFAVQKAELPRGEQGMDARWRTLKDER